MRSKIIDAWSYITGMYRDQIYGTALMRKHIKEQFEFRFYYLASVSCISNGSCEACGCMMPELLFAAKQCGGACYPKLINSRKWRKFKKGEHSLKFRREEKIGEEDNTMTAQYNVRITYSPKTNRYFEHRLAGIYNKTVELKISHQWKL